MNSICPDKSPKPHISPKPTNYKPSISPKPVISKKPVIDRSKTFLASKNSPRSAAVLRSKSVSSPFRPNIRVRTRDDKQAGGKENVSDKSDKQNEILEKSLKRRAPPPPPPPLPTIN